MTRRESKRKWKLGRARRERKYDNAFELHTYEDRVVLGLMIERGSGGARDWLTMEPGRWRKNPLQKTFERLSRRNLITHRRRFSGGWRGRHTTVYYPVYGPFVANDHIHEHHHPKERTHA